MFCQKINESVKFNSEADELFRIAKFLPAVKGLRDIYMATVLILYYFRRPIDISEEREELPASVVAPSVL